MTCQNNHTIVGIEAPATRRIALPVMAKDTTIARFVARQALVAAGGTSETAWTVDRIAKWAGISDRTVDDWLRKDRRKDADTRQSRPIAQSALLPPATPPSHRLSIDGRKAPIKHKPAGVMQYNATRRGDGDPTGAAARPTALVRPFPADTALPDGGAPGTALLARLRAAVAATEAQTADLDTAHSSQLVEVEELARRMVDHWGMVVDWARCRQAEGRAAAS